MQSGLQVCSIFYWVLSLWVIPSLSIAQMAQNLMIGNAKALALGNAVTADPPGIDSIHFNPAGLARMSGQQVHLKFVLGDADVYGQFSSNDAYDSLLDEYKLQDPMADSESHIDSFAVYLPGTGVTKVPALLAALGGASYQPPGADVTFATAVYAPLMLGYVRDKNDIGRFYGREIGMSRITFFSPTLAWQLSDTVSVGLGMGFSYTGIGLNLDYRAANPVIGVLYTATEDICSGAQGELVWEGVALDLCGGSISPFNSLLTLQVELEKSLSVTYNLGVLWQPISWLTAGVVYQSESDDRLKGDIRVSLDEQVTGMLHGVADSGALFQSIVEATELLKHQGVIETSGYIDLVLPQHFALGISVQLWPDLKVNIDYKWTETSQWENFAFHFDERLPVMSILSFIDGIEEEALIFPRGYEDASNMAYGVEYQYSDQLSLRLGYEPRNSGVPDNRLDFLIPIGDFDLYGAGFSYQLDKASVLDVSLGYAKSDQKIPAGSSRNGNYYAADNFVYNPSAGLDVRSVIEFKLMQISYRAEID